MLTHMLSNLMLMILGCCVQDSSWKEQSEWKAGRLVQHGYKALDRSEQQLREESKKRRGP